MSKPVAGAGPTAAAAAAAAQKQKSLLQRLDTDIGNIVDNFSLLVNVARVNDLPVRNSQEAFQMEMRAARMVQAADSLLKLVSELKQTAIFSGFESLNENVEQRIGVFDQLEERTDGLVERIGEQGAVCLGELETHYYSSVQRVRVDSLVIMMVERSEKDEVGRLAQLVRMLGEILLKVEVAQLKAASGKAIQ